MPYEAPAEEIEFLLRVRRLGLQGKTQQEIADTLEMSLSGMRARINRLGFEPFGLTDLRTILGERPIAEMLEAGDLVPVGEAGEAVEVAA